MPEISPSGLTQLAAYVALSRATTMESLEVVHFHPSK